MSAGRAENVCLQCGESRESVRANEYICATVSGYEYREVDQEWERHHWRDWSDAELRRLGITEWRWNRARRMLAADLEWERIESICDREGHKEASGEFAADFPRGRCVRCFADLELAKEGTK